MKASFPFHRAGRAVAAFTLVELLVAAAIAVSIVGSLFAASIALQREFSAAADQSGAQRDQMRVVDYVTRDLRRATAVSVTNSGSKLILSIPDHRDPSNGGTRVPTISAEGLVAYGNPSHTVSYFIEGSTFLRIEEGAEKVIANTVEQFDVAQNAPSVVTFTIGFSPHVSWRRVGGTPTTLTSTVFLRNARGGFVL